MTKEELGIMGLYQEDQQLYPNRYWCNVTQSSFTIDGNETPETIMDKVFQEGIRQGIRDGMERRSEQIMALLNNTDI